MEHNTIYDNTMVLDCFAADITEGAKDFYTQNPTEGRSTRDRVEYWFENFFLPAFECAFDDIFEEED